MSQPPITRVIHDLNRLLAAYRLDEVLPHLRPTEHQPHDYIWRGTDCFELRVDVCAIDDEREPVSLGADFEAFSLTLMVAPWWDEVLHDVAVDLNESLFGPTGDMSLWVALMTKTGLAWPSEVGKDSRVTWYLPRSQSFDFSRIAVLEPSEAKTLTDAIAKQAQTK